MVQPRPADPTPELKFLHSLVQLHRRAINPGLIEPGPKLLIRVAPILMLPKNHANIGSQLINRIPTMTAGMNFWVYVVENIAQGDSGRISVGDDRRRTARGIAPASARKVLLEVPLASG
jgi:hypothetical protein